jgi:nitrogenase molybdenum-cofactor synthesis protein NifE
VRRSHGAALNVVQCSGALTFLAEMMKETYGIPYIRASYFGIEDMAKALYDVADHFSDPGNHGPHQDIVRSEVKGHHARTQSPSARPGRQTGSHLRGGRLQGVFTDQGLTLPGHEGRAGGLPDRQPGITQPCRDVR